MALVECIDVLSYTPRWFALAYPYTYLLLVRRLSWAWKLCYSLLDTRLAFCIAQPLRRIWNLFIARRFIDFLKQGSYDAVVTTHFLVADIIRAGKASGWLKCPCVVVVTDLYPHWFWIAPECDAMVVATRGAAAVCKQRGVSPERVMVAGIPIDAAFARPCSQDDVKAHLDLTSERLTVLATSGGTTVGQFGSVVASLLSIEKLRPGLVQLIVVCGDDERSRRHLEAVGAKSRMPLRVFGFVDNMAELMAACDLIVAKAGGLTLSEALARGRPLILYHVIPGQESMNARYVSNEGAALIANRIEEVAGLVIGCLEDSSRLGSMRRAAEVLGKPHAAEEIVGRLVAPLLGLQRKE